MFFNKKPKKEDSSSERSKIDENKLVHDITKNLEPSTRDQHLAQERRV
jgi:hypothetical protein